MVTPLVSAIVVTLNRRADLPEAIESLRRQTYDNIEVIVVDNGSNDGTPQMVKESFPDVRLVELPNNTGAYHGRNVGAAAARGEILYFLDDDATLERSSISSIVERFSTEETLGVIVCKLIDARTGLPDPQVLDQRLYLDLARPLECEIYLGNMIAEGITAIRRDVFEKVGGWPAHYFRASVGKELSFRIIDAGYNIIWFPEAVAYHKYSPLGEISRKQIETRKTFYRTRNLLWIYWTHMPVPRAIFESGLTISYFLVDSVRNGVFPLFVKGVMAALAGMPRLLRAERRQVSKEALAKIDYLIYGSIVTDSAALDDIVPMPFFKVMRLRFKFLRALKVRPPHQGSNDG